MDTFTQAYLGAAAAQALARPDEVRKATAIGLVAGALADADIFIRTPNDPLFGVLMHRHFTHALVFIPLGALLAVLLSRLFRVKISFGRAWLFAFAAYATHAPLDLCTSYGTAILWPFSSGRYSWDIISIIDPVFTGVLVLLIALCWFRRSPLLARSALAKAVKVGKNRMQIAQINSGYADEPVRGHNAKIVEGMEGESFFERTHRLAEKVAHHKIVKIEVERLIKHPVVDPPVRQNYGLHGKVPFL